jgi:hypothetical protein
VERERERGREREGERERERENKSIHISSYFYSQITNGHYIPCMKCYALHMHTQYINIKHTIVLDK